MKSDVCLGFYGELNARARQQRKLEDWVLIVRLKCKDATRAKRKFKNQHKREMAEYELRFLYVNKIDVNYKRFF